MKNYWVHGEHRYLIQNNEFEFVCSLHCEFCPTWIKSPPATHSARKCAANSIHTCTAEGIGIEACSDSGCLIAHRNRGARPCGYIAKRYLPWLSWSLTISLQPRNNSIYLLKRKMQKVLHTLGRGDLGVRFWSFPNDRRIMVGQDIVHQRSIEEPSLSAGCKLTGLQGRPVKFHHFGNMMCSQASSDMASLFSGAVCTPWNVQESPGRKHS